MTKIGFAGQEPLLGDYREFQDVRETGVKPLGAEFRLRAMPDFENVKKLVNQRATLAVHTIVVAVLPVVLLADPTLKDLPPSTSAASDVPGPYRPPPAE